MIEIQAAADGDCIFTHGNGIELLIVAQRTAELVKIEQKFKQSYYDEAVIGWTKFHELQTKEDLKHAAS